MATLRELIERRFEVENVAGLVKFECKACKRCFVAVSSDDKSFGARMLNHAYRHGDIVEDVSPVKAPLPLQVKK